MQTAVQVRLPSSLAISVPSPYQVWVSWLGRFKGWPAPRAVIPALEQRKGLCINAAHQCSTGATAKRLSESRGRTMEKMPEPGRIFVSYRRNDSAYPTGWLTDRLVEHYGENQIFTDVDSIDLGDNFVTRITAAVASCDVLLAVIGPKWLTVNDENGRRRLDDPNDYVRIEIEAALRRQILVVPILVDGANMPRVSDLPGKPTVPGDEPEPNSLATLPYREALAVHPDQFDWAMGRLVKKLDQVLSLPATHRVSSTPRRGTVPNVDQTQGDGTAFDRRLRWGLIGLLVAAVCLMLLVLPLVFDDVRTARDPQPQAAAWIAFLWLLPGLAALMSLALTISNRASTAGDVFGFTAAAAWMVAASWTLLAHRSEPHSAIHAMALLMLLAATVGVATSPPLRQRVQSNSTWQILVALSLALAGFFVRTQASVLAKALLDESSVAGSWVLHSNQWTVRIGEIVPFVACVVAASLHGNACQTRAVRTLVGVIIACEIGIPVGTLYNDLNAGNVTAAALVPSVLRISGAILLWWAVCIGQPKRRAARWLPRQARSPRRALDIRGQTPSDRET